MHIFFSLSNFCGVFVFCLDFWGISFLSSLLILLPAISYGIAVFIMARKLKPWIAQGHKKSQGAVRDYWQSCPLTNPTGAQLQFSKFHSLFINISMSRVTNKLQFLALLSIILCSLFFISLVISQIKRRFVCLKRLARGWNIFLIINSREWNPRRNRLLLLQFRGGGSYTFTLVQILASVVRSLDAINQLTLLCDDDGSNDQTWGCCSKASFSSYNLCVLALLLQHLSWAVVKTLMQFLEVQFLIMERALKSWHDFEFLSLLLETNIKRKERKLSLLCYYLQIGIYHRLN